MRILSPTPTCRRFTAGHQMHRIQWLQSLASTPLSARPVDVGVDGAWVTLETDTGTGTDPIRWWHHDLPRLITALDGAGTSVRVWPALGALRIGDLWFSCSTADRSDLCSSTREA